MKKLSISMVSYLNSKPFLLGLQKEQLLDQVEVQLEHPAATAKRLQNHLVDIALVPVAVLPSLPSDCSIITSYCIGSNHSVDSVFLLSNSPLSSIQTIFLDYQSKTSAKLIQILAKEHWNIHPQFVSNTDILSTQLGTNDACLLIGDKAMTSKHQFTYCYDLAEQWYKLTGLPFVFAVWVAKNKDIGLAWEKDLNRAFATGLKHKKELYPILQSYFPSWINAEYYFTQSIDYVFDSSKKKALQLFLEKSKEL